MAYTKTYNPCDDCQYSFTKNNQESGMCNICEFKGLIDSNRRAQCQINRLKKYDEERDIEFHARLISKAKTEVAREILAEIEKEIDTGLSVISKILNAKGGRANGKTVLLSKYDVFIEAKKHLAKLKKKYTEENE